MSEGLPAFRDHGNAVWVCIPSARPVPEVREWMKAWRKQGYKIALYRNTVDDLVGMDPELHADWCLCGEYPGYAQASNQLAAEILRMNPACEWLVFGGDDVTCDMSHTADEIAAQCSDHFRDDSIRTIGLQGETFGVMQPTGDRWGDDAAARAMWPDAPAMIDRICGSPWIGREFARRVNGGKGPLWPEYFHNWADEELQNVAIKLGCFWQRRDLIHYHNHSLRMQGGKWLPHQQGFNADYMKMEPLFRKRQAAGFPGHEVIA